MPLVGFSQTHYNVSEGQLTPFVELRRCGEMSSTANVTINIQPLSSGSNGMLNSCSFSYGLIIASNNFSSSIVEEDFPQANPVISLESGKEMVTVAFPITDDNLVEDDKTYSLSLEAVTGTPLVLVPLYQASLLVHDDDSELHM